MDWMLNGYGTYSIFRLVYVCVLHGINTLSSVSGGDISSVQLLPGVSDWPPVSGPESRLPRS